MNAQIVIQDTRPEWMRAEDALFACMIKCSLYKRCSTRSGFDCKHLGGHVIPKIRS